MMLLDKVFWLWFILSAATVFWVYLTEASSFSVLFGVLIAGLGLVKLAEEAGKSKLEKEGKKDVRISTALLRKLDKGKR